MKDLVAELEARARARFARWDGATWAKLVEGPAAELARALKRAHVDPARAETLLADYLELGCEGIGLGYIVPPESGATTVLTLAWTRLIPKQLAALPPGPQAEALAKCWNLGENLESQPVWLRRIFLRACEKLDGLGGLAELVEDVSRRALAPPGRPLSLRFEPRWVHLAEDDPRFLPGSLHFASPVVACVHDRLRKGVSIGVWLDDAPLLLGPLGCSEAPPGDPGLDLELLEALASRDALAADWHAMARNAWRAGVTLTTSQSLVALLPA